MAELISLGEPPPTIGGDFEKLCSRRLRDELPDGVLVLTSVDLDRGGGTYYEIDIVVSAPGFCQLIECKCFRPAIDVHDDAIVTSEGLVSDRVFSVANRKAKVLGSRLRATPFMLSSPYVSSIVVVPDETDIAIRHAPYVTQPPVVGLSELVDYYRAVLADPKVLPAPGQERAKNRNGWIAFRDRALGRTPAVRRLGRFRIKQQLASAPLRRDYLAVDEAPCAVDVHLREFGFDPTLPRGELRELLQQISREFRILRQLRHPNLACVVGHFQTGTSWVQVSDWFDGRPLEDRWRELGELPLRQRLALFAAVLDALQFCHERGVFHRNLDARFVTVDDQLAEIRVGGFECASDIGLTSRLTATSLVNRDQRLIPPEELTGGSFHNLRLGDVFQAGVLLYRFIAGGGWPFDSSLEHAVSGGREKAPPGGLRAEESRVFEIARRMMSPDPSVRPDMLARVRQELMNAVRE